MRIAFALLGIVSFGLCLHLLVGMPPSDAENKAKICADVDYWLNRAELHSTYDGHQGVLDVIDRRREFCA